MIDYKHPEYEPVFAERVNNLKRLRADKTLINNVRSYYKDNPVAFINDWFITFDPRNVERGLPAKVPFLLFPKQTEFIEWLRARWQGREDGLCEKSRDMGVSWLCAAFAVWLWLYWPGTVTGFGSRKEAYVDDLNNPASLFWKIREAINHLPPEFKPAKWDAPFMRIVNHENGSVIVGEAGDNIGRGNRTSIYFKDEALILSSKVLTPGGWVLMGDLTMNSKVIGIDGSEKNITHINDCGEFETYHVSFSDGTIVECSPNHLWTVNEVIGKRKTVTARTSEMHDRYKYISPGGQTQYRYRMPLIAPADFSKRDLPLHPYIVGALLGDGGVSQVPKNSPKITSIDEDLIDYFKSKLPDHCLCVREKEGISYRLSDVRGKMGWKHKSRIRQNIVEAGIAGKRSWEKSIPDDYKYSTVEDRLALLQGLMDTDGSAGKSGGSAAYYTSSKMLAEDVRFLAESLGGYATMKVKRDKRGYRDQYALFIVLPDEFDPFILKRKLDIYKRRKNTIERSIVSIEKTGRRETVRCISIDSDDGLYLTEGCIPTHNSAFYERPEAIDAALSQTSNCKIDVSTPNGAGNPFYRKRHGGKIPVFVFDWHDDPRKDEEWYQKQCDSLDPVIVAQEIDRNYTASVSNSWIQADLVSAAMNRRPGDIEAIGEWQIGVDVARFGDDKTVITFRKGRLVLPQIVLGKLDTVDVYGRVKDEAKYLGNVGQIAVDDIGVGGGVTDMLRRDFGNKVVGVNSAIRLSDGQNYNLRARIWRDMRDWLENACLPNDSELQTDLTALQYNYKAGELLLESKQDAKKRGVKSPDRADSLALTFAEPLRNQRKTQNRQPTGWMG